MNLTDEQTRRENLMRSADNIDKEYRRWTGRSANAARKAGYIGPMVDMLRKADAIRAEAAAL